MGSPKRIRWAAMSSTRHLTPGSRSALLRNACHRRHGKVASVKGGGKPFAALAVGSRAFVNPKTLAAIDRGGMFARARGVSQEFIDQEI